LRTARLARFPGRHRQSVPCCSLTHRAEGDIRSPADILELVLDPLLDVAPAIADMSAYSEAWRSLTSIPPLVEGGYRHSEVIGELLDGGEPVLVFHVLDDGWAPSQLTPMTPLLP